MDIPDKLKWITEVDGINAQEGLHNCGMPEQYVKFLRTFYDTLDDRLFEIETAYKVDDIETYTIKVHSLKSTARIMGAKELSDLAEELEDAGDHGDMDLIDEKTQELLDMCGSFKEKLEPIENTEENDLLDPNTKKPPISESDLANAYDAIMEFIPQMDYDAVEMVLSALKEDTLPPRDGGTVRELEKRLRSFDWEGLETLMEQIVGHD